MEIILILLFQQLLFCKEISIKLYDLEDQVISNPDRGFFIQRSTSIKEFVPLLFTELQDAKLKHHITLVLRIYYLTGYQFSSLPASFKSKIKNDFRIAHQAGVKLILRFAYSKPTLQQQTQKFIYGVYIAPYHDAPKRRILQHIQQLQPIFRQYQNQIFAVDAGFVGMWGEWYYSDYFCEGPGQLTQKNIQDRKEVLDALLQALNNKIYLLVPTTQLKGFYYGSQFQIEMKQIKLLNYNAVDHQVIEESSKLIGFHDHCLLSNSESDFQTFPQPYDINWAYQETNYVAFGGNVCQFQPENLIQVSCQNSLKEMEKLHVQIIIIYSEIIFSIKRSFLYRNLKNDVIKNWELSGCLQKMQIKLGYNIYLLKSIFPKIAYIGDSIFYKIKLKNDGFAAPLYNKKIVLILANIDSNQIAYKQEISTNITRWFPNIAIDLSGQLFSLDKKPGHYKIKIQICNYEDDALLKPIKESCIRLFNQKTWNNQEKSNNLFQKIELKKAEEMKNIDYSSLDSQQEINNILKQQERNQIKSKLKYYQISKQQEEQIDWHLLINICEYDMKRLIKRYHKYVNLNKECSNFLAKLKIATQEAKFIDQPDNSFMIFLQKDNQSHYKQCNQQREILIQKILVVKDQIDQCKQEIAYLQKMKQNKFLY